MTSAYSSISKDAFSWPTTETEAALKRIRELEQKRLQFKGTSSSSSDAGTRLSRRQQLGAHRIGSRRFADGHEDRRSTILVRRRIHENTNSDTDSTLSMSHGSLDTTESYRYGGARPKNVEISSFSKRSFLPQHEDNYMRERSSSLTNSGENESIALFRSQSVTGLSSGETGSYEISLGSDIKDSNIQPAESTANTSISEDEEDIENFKRSLLGLQNLANVPEREEPVLQPRLPKFTRNENEINTSRLLVQPSSKERTYSNTKFEPATNWRNEKKIENILSDSMKKFDKIFETPKISSNLPSTLPRSQRSLSRLERLSQNTRLSSSSGRSFQGTNRDSRRVQVTGHVESSDDHLSRHQQNYDNIQNINVSDKEIDMLKTDTMNGNNIEEKTYQDIFNETSETSIGENDRNGESQTVPKLSDILHTEDEESKIITENSVVRTDGQINFKSGFISDTSDPKETQTSPETSDNNEKTQTSSEPSVSTNDRNEEVKTSEFSSSLIGNDQENFIESEFTINNKSFQGISEDVICNIDLDIQTSHELHETYNEYGNNEERVTTKTDDHVTMQTDDHVAFTDDQVMIQTNIEEGNEHSTSDIDYKHGHSIDNPKDANNPYTSLVTGEMEEDLVDASNVNFFETFNNQPDRLNENMFDYDSKNETNFPRFSSTGDFLNYDQNIRYESEPNGSMYKEQDYDTFPSRSQRSMSLDHQSHFRTLPYSVSEQDRPSSRIKSFKSDRSAGVCSKIDEIFDQKSKLKEIESRMKRARPRDSLTNSRRVSRTHSDVGHGTKYGSRYNASSFRRTFTNGQNINDSTNIQGSHGTAIDNSRDTDSYLTNWRRGREENDSFIEQIRARVYANRDSQHRTSLFDRSKSLDLTPSDQTVMDGNDFFYDPKSDTPVETNNENIGSEISALTSEISSEFDMIDNSKELNDTLMSENEITDIIPHTKDETDNTEMPLDEELTFTSSCQVEVGKVLVCTTENIKGTQLEGTDNNEIDESVNVVRKCTSSDDSDMLANNEKHSEEHRNVEKSTEKDKEKISSNSTDKTTDDKSIDDNSIPSSSSKRKKNKKKGKKGNNSDTSKIIVSHPSELLAREKKAKKDFKVNKDNLGKSEKESITEEKSDKRGKGLLSSISSKNKKQKDKTADTLEKSPKKSEKRNSEKKSPEKEEIKQTNTESPKSPSKLKNLFDSIIHALDYKSETSSTSTASLEDNKSPSSGEKTPVAEEWEIISEPSSELNIIHEDNYATFTDEDIVQEKRRLSDEISGMSTDNYETASDHTISCGSEYEEFYEALPTELIDAWSENELLMETERKEKFVYVCAESKVRSKRKKFEYNVENVGEWISNNLYPGEKYPEQGENVANKKFNEIKQRSQNGGNESSVIIQKLIRKEESSEPSNSQPIEINNHKSNQVHHVRNNSLQNETELVYTETDRSNEMKNSRASNSALTETFLEKRRQKSLQDESAHGKEVKQTNEQIDLTSPIRAKTEVVEKAASLQLESVPTEKIQLDLKASDAGFTDTLVNTLREKLCSSCQGVLLDVLKQTYFSRYEEISKINLTESDVSRISSVNKDQKSEIIKVNSRSEGIRINNFPKTHVGKKLKVEDLLYGDSKDQEINSVKKTFSERNMTAEQSKTDKSKGTETVIPQKSKSRETTPTKIKGKLSILDKSPDSSISVKASPRKNSVEIKIKGKTVSMDKNKKEEKISPKSEQKLCRQNSKTGNINENTTENGTNVSTEDKSDKTDDNEEYRLPTLKNNPFIKSDKLRTSVRKENREKKNDKTTKTVVLKSKASSDSSDQSIKGAKSSKSPSPDEQQDSKSSNLTKQDSKSSSPEKQDSKSSFPAKLDSKFSSPGKQDSKSSYLAKQDSKSSSPEKQDSKSSSPAKQDSKSSSPEKQDSKSSSPAKQDSKSSSPSKQDNKSSSSEKQDIKTKANGIDSSKSSSPGEPEGETVANGIDSIKSSSPGHENIEKIVETGKNNNVDSVRKTSTSGSKKPSMFDHLNFAKTVCKGLGPVGNDANKDKNTETINKSNSEDTVQKKTKTPPKKKKFSPFGDTDIIDELDISPEELHGVPVDGDDEIAPHRINLINWDPTKLLNVLYMVKLMKDTVEDVSHKFVNMEGLMEKLPMNKKKATLLKTWKRRFFRAKDGWLHYYETSNRDRPSDSVQLMGGKIEDLGNRVLGVDDGRGRFLMVRCPTEKEYGQWKLALESQTVDNVKATYVRPALSSPPHPEKKVIIIDIGSGGIRAGIMGAQPCLPKIFIPSVVARNKTTQELVIGIDAYKPEVRKNSTLVKLVEPSNKVDKFAIDMEIMKAVCEYIFKGIGVDPSKYWIMLSTPYKLGDTAMTNLMDILTDKFHVKGVCMVMQSLLALYSYNATSGILVDIGERMEILPIFDGVLIEGGVSRQAYGGQKVTDSLNSSLLELKYKFFSQVDKLLVRYVMEQSCYVCDNYKEEKSKCDKDPQDYQTTIYLNNFDLPDDSHLSVTHDISCFKSPEGFFHTDLWGMDYPCVHKLVHQAIQSCPMDNRKHMYRAIYLSGGVTMLPGFAERLQSELKKLAPPSVVVEVHASPQRYHSAFIGAGTLLSNVPINEQIFISSEEWKRDKVKAFRKWKGP